MFAKTIHLTPPAGPAPRVLRGECDVVAALKDLRRLAARNLVAPVTAFVLVGGLVTVLGGAAGLAAGAGVPAALAVAGGVLGLVLGGKASRTLARWAA